MQLPHKNDVISICSLIAGICSIVASVISETVTTTAQTIHPGSPPVMPVGVTVALAVIGAVGTIASQVIRIYSVPTAPAGTSYVVTTAPDTVPVPQKTTAPIAAANDAAPKGP